MTRPYAKALGAGVGLLALAAAGEARAQDRSRYVAPYIEVNQVVTADLNADDVTTYTSLAAGVDAGISSTRANAQVSYRYERRIEWDDDIADGDVHSGLALANFALTPALTIEGGAIATRTRSDIRGSAPGVLGGDLDNITQVYSAYLGPSLSTNVGAVQLGASYRAGYTKVEAPNSVILAPGERPRDYFDDSWNHVAQATAGFAAGTLLPVGVTVSGAYEREDAGQLDQRYEGYYGRGDMVLPLSPTFAIRGGVGYEKIETSSRDPLLNAGSEPVLDGNGRYVTDPASPRRIDYNTDGLIYDAGVIWRPSPRLELQANAGWRYGSEIYTGTLSWQMARDMALGVQVYDGIETFGRQLRDGLDDLPTAFQTQPDPFGQQFAGCVFGARPGGTGAGGGAGGCLNDVFQSIATSSYRARGIDGVLSIDRGRTQLGVGAGYAHRGLHSPYRAPGTQVFGVDDQSAYGQFFWSRALSRVSNLDANLFANWYDTDQPGSSAVYGAGATATYSHQFGRLSTVASAGVYVTDQRGFEALWSAQALLGARYTF